MTDASLRLAWFTHRYYPFRGGSENFGRAMVRRFVAGGNAVDVITSDAYDLWYFTNKRHRRVSSPDVEWVDGARVRRYRVAHFPAQRYVGRLLGRLPAWPLRCCFESYMPFIPGLTRVADTYSAVVAVGFPYTLFAYAAYKTARRAGAPLVVVPFLHLATPGDRVNKQYTRPHQQRLLREADCVVVQTDIESDAVVRWGIPRERVLKLGMAIDREEVIGGDRIAARQRWNIPGAARAIGQLGALDPNKGTCDLVRAVERLNRERPETDPVYLLLAGPPSPAFESFISALPPATSQWLRRLGVIDDNDRRHFYAAIDAYAMPSRTDSFGIVFLEAWANRLPVIAARAGGVSEVVEHNRTGLLVSFGDILGLADALQGVLENAALARGLAEAGAAHVCHDRFTWGSRYVVLRQRLEDLLAARDAVDRRIPRPHLARSSFAGKKA